MIHYARIQIIKGKLVIKTRTLRGGMEMEGSELMVKKNPQFTEIFGLSVARVEDHLAQMGIYGPMGQNKALKPTQATLRSKPKREALKRLAELIKHNP